MPGKKRGTSKLRNKKAVKKKPSTSESQEYQGYQGLDLDIPSGLGEAIFRHFNGEKIDPNGKDPGHMFPKGRLDTMLSNEALGITDEQVEAYLKKGPDLNEEDGVAFASKMIMKGIFDKGQTLGEAMGMSKSQINGIYSQGYLLYNGGKYEDACNIFELLTIFDPTNTSYLFAKACAQQKAARWEEAIVNFTLYSIYEQEDPLPFFYASDCYMKLNEPKSCASALILCTDRCRLDLEKWQHLLDQCNMTIEAIQNRLEKIPESKLPKSKLTFLAESNNTEGREFADKYFSEGAELDLPQKVETYDE